MKKELNDIVKKCIGCNFLINDIIKSNDLMCKSNFINIKNENLFNIKILCYLYEYLYKDVLIPENLNNLELSKNHHDNIRHLFKLFFEIISDLKHIKKLVNNPYCHQFINKLIYSYFSFTSCLNCLFPPDRFHGSRLQKFNFSKIRKPNNESSSNSLREICISSIEFYFDYLINKNNLLDETLETFFQNDPNNKFLQYFFNCEDRSFKIRVSVKDSSVFYMYQVIDNPLETSPSMNKDDAKLYSDSYLEKKLEDEFSYLVFDKDYLNVYSYMNIPEYYKFKYNFKDDFGKINLNKGIYITIDTRFIYIQELCLF